MGDRANIEIIDDTKHSVFLYTHGRGYELPEVLQAALIRGKDRWDDTYYLTRIIFCEMVKGKEKDLTGFGISAQEGDGTSGHLIQITPDMQTLLSGTGAPTSRDHWPGLRQVQQKSSLIILLWWPVTRQSYPWTSWSGCCRCEAGRMTR